MRSPNASIPFSLLRIFLSTLSTFLSLSPDFSFPRSYFCWGQFQFPWFYPAWPGQREKLSWWPEMLYSSRALWRGRGRLRRTWWWRSTLAVRENSCLAAIDKGNKYLNQILIMNTISSFIRLGFLCFNIKLQWFEMMTYDLARSGYYAVKKSRMIWKSVTNS